MRHKLLFDESEALLCARLAAFLLEPKVAANSEMDVALCMELLAAAKASTGKARVAVGKLREQAGKIRAGKAVVVNVASAFRGVLATLRDDGFSGDPAKDWLVVKRALRRGGQAELMTAAAHLDYLVAFQRGHRISANLSAEWMRDGAYTRARSALDQALAQEQILGGVEAPAWLQVMNFHKAKGKQFDGVVIVREVRRAGPSAESSFVWRGDAAPHEKSRRLLRVAVTRARFHALVLNPYWPACPLLRGLEL